MKVIDDGTGGVPLHVDDAVVEALNALGRALTNAGMAARVRLFAEDGESSIDFALGRDATRRGNPLRARADDGRGSRLGIDDLEM